MSESTRLEISFNEDWLFRLGDSETYSGRALDENGWTALVLPHDWSIGQSVDEKEATGGGGGYAVTGIGWYRKRFSIPDDMKGKRIFLRFEGVFMDSSVYLNGVRVGGRAYGYCEFMIEITDSLAAGENLLAVRVNNSLQPNSRWYTGSGIYRNVWLLATGDIHIDHDGVFIMTNGIYNDQTAARLQIQTWVKNQSELPCDIGVEQTVYDAGGAEAAKAASALHVEAGGCARNMVMPQIKDPHLWTDRDPYLYTVVTTLIAKGKPIDKVVTRTGVRTATFDCDKGFLLNGKSVKIKGLCVHHDGGVTGAASYRETWERRLKTLKTAGCNGIRCAHNPPAIDLLDLCDELGFLVMDEAFDEWQMTKIKSAQYGYSTGFAHGYGQHFDENADADITTMLRRDRNHPSVVIWSIGNEIPEQYAVEGVSILMHLQDICHKEDPSRMVCSACDNLSAAETSRTRDEFSGALDVVGYNYVGRWGINAETLYDVDRKKYPKRRMLGTENPSAGGTRGNYEKMSGNMFRRSYDTATLTHEFLWRYTASRDFVAGDYLWTGIDYLGESRWPQKGSQSGMMDTAGFPKDTYYYFRSIWNSDDITLHIIPHWNWAGKEGEFITVIGYTNCEEVSLYLNGKLVGTKGYDFPNVGSLGAWNIRAKDTRPTTHDLHLAWDVPYEPGEIKAVGYVGGKVVSEVTIKTTGKAAKLTACADRSELSVHGIAHIEIASEDNEGLMVPDAANIVRIKVEGAAKLIGMDNGNQGDLAAFADQERALYAGRLLAVIRGAEKGEAKVTLSSDGMEDVVLKFTIV